MNTLIPFESIILSSAYVQLQTIKYFKRISDFIPGYRFKKNILLKYNSYWSGLFGCKLQRFEYGCEYLFHSHNTFISFVKYVARSMF